MDSIQVSIPNTSSVRHALQLMDDCKSQFAAVIENGSLIGVITDGDIRRSLLRGLDLDTVVTKVMNVTPKTLRANHGLTNFEVRKLMTDLKIRALPVVDESSRLVEIIFMENLGFNQVLDLPVLIMAGGKGERLKPITDKTPKPLIKVGSQTIIERLVRNFASQNFRKIYVAVHHKKELFFEVLGDGSQLGVEITYLHEQSPLGTAGAISLLPDLALQENLLVSNADLIHEINFEEMYNFHLESKNDITVASTPFPVNVPYGVINYKQNELIGIDEKPVFEYRVMSGINILGKRILEHFQSSKPIDMVSVITGAIQKNLSVKVYFADSHWVDIGDPKTLAREISYFEKES